MAFFVALCFFFSAMELAIPKPVPFFRLGLANIPIMLSFKILSPLQILLLIVLKVLVQGIVSGTLFSYIFLFSFCGSFASGISMMIIYLLLKKRNLISWIGISLTGGFFNNFSQIVLAYFFIFGSNTKFIAPMLLTITLFTSTALGIYTNWFCSKESFTSIMNFENPITPQNFIEESTNRKLFKIHPVISTLFLINTFFTNDIRIIYATIFIFILMNLLNKNKIKFLPSISIIFFVTLFNIFSPQGKVLYSIWKLKITQDALMNGLIKSGKLCACVYISKMIISNIKFNKGRTGEFIKTVFYYIDELNRNYKSIFFKK